LVTAGTYYYTVSVFLRRLQGIVEENQSGFISVVDAKQAATE